MEKLVNSTLSSLTINYADTLSDNESVGPESVKAQSAGVA